MKDWQLLWRKIQVEILSFKGLNHERLIAIMEEDLR
jgi:hypothetical protein